VSQLLEHSFLTVEPEVVLQSANENRTHLTLQVVFKGSDKLSVKFEFNTEKDTAEEVVREMVRLWQLNKIEEKVLHQKYQALITHEINRILRDVAKISQISEDQNKEENKKLWKRPLTKEEEMVNRKGLLEQEKKGSLIDVDLKRKTGFDESKLKSDKSEHLLVVDLKDEFIVEYADEQPIEDLVRDTAILNNRGSDKAQEWLAGLKAQDIMTVGDLRDLHDEDWANLGLTVFASRALRNLLYGKNGKNSSPKFGIPSINTPPSISNTLGESEEALMSVKHDEENE
jgi:hypothetical protein